MHTKSGRRRRAVSLSIGYVAKTQETPSSSGYFIVLGNVCNASAHVHQNKLHKTAVFFVWFFSQAFSAWRICERTEVGVAHPRFSGAETMDWEARTTHMIRSAGVHYSLQKHGASWRQTKRAAGSRRTMEMCHPTFDKRHECR